jgi:hypothetical protein
MEMIGAMMQAKSGFVIIFAAFARYITGNGAFTIPPDGTVRSSKRISCHQTVTFVGHTFHQVSNGCRNPAQRLLATASAPMILED